MWNERARKSGDQAVIERMLVIALLVSAAAIAQEPDWGAVQIRTTGLGNGVYMLEGLGGNIGLSVGEDGVFMIDDQFAPLTPKILAAIAEVTDRRINFVINTHWHYDHVGGNEQLGIAGATIISHDNARLRMAADGPNQVPLGGLPVITYSETTTFHYNGHEIHAFHPLPAHTDGDSVIQFRDVDIIHAGDVFWNGLYPFIDTDSGGSVAGVITTLRKIANLAGPDTQVIPGHGPLGNKADVGKAADMIEESLDRVASLVADGKNLDEIKAADLFSDYNPTWGVGFINPAQWAETMYNATAAQ